MFRVRCRIAKPPSFQFQRLQKRFPTWQRLLLMLGKLPQLFVVNKSRCCCWYFWRLSDLLARTQKKKWFGSRHFRPQYRQHLAFIDLCAAFFHLLFISDFYELKGKLSELCLVTRSSCVYVVEGTDSLYG